MPLLHLLLLWGSTKGILPVYPEVSVNPKDGGARSDGHSDAATKPAADCLQAGPAKERGERDVALGGDCSGGATGGPVQAFTKRTLASLVVAELMGTAEKVAGGWGAEGKERDAGGQ